MGWDFICKDIEDPKGYLDAEFSGQRTSGAATRILRSAMVGSVYYAAAEYTRPAEPTVVYAIVALTSRRGGEFGYKDMDDSMGPHESKCPVQILALLSPTKSDYANKWRERCWAYGGVVRSAELFQLEAPRVPDSVVQGRLL